MEFNLEKAREQFGTGHFASIVQGIGATTHPVRQVPAEARSLFAHALVYTGRLALASQLANSLQEADSSPTAKAEARIALGLLRKRESRIDEACGEFGQCS